MNKEYKENFVKAGAMAKEVRAFGKSLITKGASYNHVIGQINQKIVEVGAIPAFPPQIALNEVAAHFLPMPDENIVFSDQVIKLDIGVCYQGAIGDCAVTIDLSGKHQHLIDAAEAALLAAEQIIQVGLPLRTIGRVIEETIQSYGLNPVRNLSGHGLGYNKIHTAPTIPNYDNKSTGMIKAGMTFAIEPFATNGKGLIYEKGRPAIFSLVRSRPMRSEISRVFMEKIRSYNGLPFGIQEFANLGYPIPEMHRCFAEMISLGVIAGYPPLVEEAHGMVAQAENSILVDEQGKVLITTR